ncbi:MAG: NAD(P)/FAD-dependent oxidoreductase [Stigonema ocellatum SAG 48.90 = DSM 106950]|nr:NAD(P)/FAD-dependent oxidoreductase [Stigonema ocellatum SAG 48.90 = DSM 106950]
MNNPVFQTVIVGGGFTGLFTALHLAHKHYPRTVILIDKQERFCFKPLLYEYFSGEMDATQVVPRFEELLKGSGVIFVQDTVQGIDLHQRSVQLTSGTCYNYSNLVLGLGNVISYFGVKGAKEYALPFWTPIDAVNIDRHLHDRLRQAVQIEDPEQRRKLLTVAVVGGGPTGVEMAATLADLLPNWYSAMQGNFHEVRVVLLNHGASILKGDVNSVLKETAEQKLQKRAVPVEMLMGAEVTAIGPDAVEYKHNGKTETLSAATVIWTAGTATHPIIKELPIPEEHRDKRGRLKVTKTLQLPDFPEVFAGGDCTFVEDSSFPATAQVAYQQGATIAHNLKAIAFGNDLQPVRVNNRGTLLKLGLNDAAANVFDVFEVTGEPAHLIRQGTYLELLPTPIHNFNATTEWLREEIFHSYINSGDTGKKVVQTVELVGGAVVGVLAARKLLQMLGDDDEKRKS